ncbi:NUDIX hydrolase [Pseudonocardia asaccharolytica DSM 44247 = NBRC 16224]|uniref:NUDIX hydrolase n=2 Tax=Pseudonocardia asaccharolytica TaxID=54010 RepID=A0A511D1M0_9PSEU|nr:NUDIX hydrolase [Pseudonocardia asaccharolytica DSM 44247 = NBRC 16224]
MAFAGGMTVFPGGGVDPDDRPDPARWSGPEPRWWAERLGCSAELAGALVLAAVRETFEECGVLLAGPADGDPVDADVLVQGRADVVARRRTFSGLLGAADLVVRADLLRGWARWITPESSPRRYDTFFFTATVPDDQQADGATTEAVEASWWRPQDALAQWRQGAIQLMPPTLRTLRQLAEHSDTSGVLASAEQQPIEPVIPKVVRRGDEIVVVVPGDPDYPLAVDHLNPAVRP